MPTPKPVPPWSLLTAPPGRYVPSHMTNLAATFARIESERKAAAEAKSVVRQIRAGKK